MGFDPNLQYQFIPTQFEDKLGMQNRMLEDS